MQLMTKPLLILADEPTGSLDTKNTNEVIYLLRKTSRIYNQTIVMITHNDKIAEEADRVISISDGILNNFRGNFN